MTTNKPEVVAVMYQDGSVLTKQECGIAFDTCCKVETPLIRLSDYESLQAECKELRTALAESRANDLTAMGYLNQVRGIVGGDDFPDMVRKCEELRKDAERYRWLREGNNDENSEETRIAMHYYGGEWDEMVDVVMEEEGK